MAAKCHAKDTPILMFDGHTKLVQDIKVGDRLMGDDSRPRTVLSLATGSDVLYDIVPKTRCADSYSVNKDHILCLKHDDKIIEISVEEYLKPSSNTSLVGYQSDPVDFAENDEPIIDPYMFGMMQHLRPSSHVPFLQKANTYEARLLLFAGIIDGLAELQDEFTWRIDLQNSDITFLARSLGFCCVLTSDNKTLISGYNIDHVPTRLHPIKAVSLPKPHTYDITIQKRQEPETFYGFTLDGNNRYLLGDFTVTHNSKMTLMCVKKN